MNRKLNIFIILAFLLIRPHCLFAQSPEYIRVAIIQNAESLSLKAAGHYEITVPDTNIIARGKNLATTVTAYKDGISMGRINFNSDSVMISSGLEDVVINGRTFRGEIKFIRNKAGRLSAINYVELEDYIRGILYHEVSHYWPMEALKAQAIVCRTYAVYQMQNSKTRDFDVTSDIYSQVYGGKTSERYRTSNAVLATSGKILTYRGKVFPAYFHSTCGGHTEDASVLWKIDIAPLKGVPCDFCAESPHFNWHYVLTREEIRDKLTKGGFDIKDIKDITIDDRDSSGRVTDLKITSDKKELKVSAKDFRNIVGPNIIRSTNFAISLVHNDAVFEGLGWGHGVGLCQWGAYFMAKRGDSAAEILEYYYPEAKIETVRF